MSFIKRNADGTFLSLLELAAGILLLIDPVRFASGIIIAAGALFWGGRDYLCCQIFYDRSGRDGKNQLLTKGLASLLLGWLCAFHSGRFIASFPVLTLPYGILVLLVGLRKIQMAVDLIRARNKRRLPAGVSAAVPAICAAVIVNSPFGATEALWLFTGITPDDRI